GFDDDELQGNRKAVVSLELRYPFIDQLRIPFPLPLEFRNIRGSMFVDIGSVWDYSNFEAYKNGKLKDLKLGFGFGPRFNLGYFVLKLDIAWNSNLAKTSKPSFYISLMPDF
ncbi:MAG: BamA/TamA family outer membrane protein, partial [Candidatus Cloacimonadota bacterium]|nr:BamA/TamA family outer membrane protein [Candidatus Cloacimonadota bacterium]